MINDKLWHKLDTITIHVEKSDQLNTVMHKLDNLIYERFYSELDRDNMRIRYTKEIGNLLDDIVIETKKIAEAQPYKSTLSKTQYKEFLSLAHALENDAKALKTIAVNYKTEELKPTLNHMINTCNHCHAKFQKK